MVVGDQIVVPRCPYETLRIERREGSFEVCFIGTLTPTKRCTLVKEWQNIATITSQFVLFDFLCEFQQSLLKFLVELHFILR